MTPDEKKLYALMAVAEQLSLGKPIVPYQNR